MIKGHFPYVDAYWPLFSENYRRYASIRRRIDNKLARILADPYQNTEVLADRSGRRNLRGCRSAPVGRNFRIIFVICEECRRIPDCEFCFCEGLPEKAVVFLTVGPHDKAYAME